MTGEKPRDAISVPSATRTIVLTALSLVAFAANSILCRLALAEQRIDASTFTAVRLTSGAVVLGLLGYPRLRKAPWPGTVVSTLALFLYAAPFSFAYLRLGAGMGALVLFACVQVTMIGVGIARGERSSLGIWLGLATAFAGLILLAAPSANAPDLVGVLTMAVAGIAWGVYSLRGRISSAPPLATTAASFLGTAPLALGLAVFGVGSGSASVTLHGAALAGASGALASGVGYSIWYSALRGLTATRAAVVQLLVPLIAIFGGAMILDEVVSVRLLAASATILAGVAIAIFASNPRPRRV